MRPLLLAALLLAGCAGRDTPPDAWAVRGQHHRPGGPSFAEQLEDSFHRDPTGTAYAIGTVLGLIGAVILKFAR